MLTIWKYELEAAEVEIEVPHGAEALTVQIQNGIPVLWILVDSERLKTKYRVFSVGTGHELPKGARYSSYIGTVQFQEHGLVFHIFSDLPNYSQKEL